MNNGWFLNVQYFTLMGNASSERDGMVAMQSLRFAIGTL